MGINIGGLGAALDGAQQGFDHAQDRQFLQGQRDFQVQQEQRTKDQWGREDQQRTDMAAIDDSAPEDVQLRQAAAAVKQTDPNKWLELHQKADQVMWARSARQAQDLLASSGSMNAGQLATQATQIWNNSNMPVQMSNPKFDENSGQVTMDVTSRDTGQTTTRTFANKDELLKSVQALADPATYAKIQQTQLEAHIKAQEKANEPQKVSPGQALVQNGRVVYQAPPPAGFEYIGDDAQGNPQYRKLAGGAGGATNPAGKPVKGATGNVSLDAQTALDTVLQHSGEKPDATIYAAAKENVGRITAQNPKVPPEMAARVALDLAKDPNKAVPAIDPETGKIDLVYDDGVNGKIKVNVGVGDAVNVASVQAVIAKRMAAANGGKDPDPTAVQQETRRALQTMTKSMMTQFDPKRREQYTLAAFNPEERRKMNESLRTQAEQVIEQSTAGKTPEQATAIRNAVEQSLAQRQRAVDNVVNLVYNYGDKPQQQKGSGIQAPRGLAAAASYTPDPNSPAGRAFANRQRVQQQQQAQSEQQRADKAAQQAKVSAEFQKDSKTMSPEDLVRKYDTRRGELPMSDLQALKQFEQKL